MIESPDEPVGKRPTQSTEQELEALPNAWADPDDPEIQLGKVLEELEQNGDEPVQRGELVQVLRTIQIQHSGPLPTPAMLQQYNDVIPNGAERIMAMAEREQGHRHELERRDQKLMELSEQHEFQITQRGQLLAFGICLAVLAAAIVLAVAGHPTVAAVLVGLDLVGLAAVFVVGRYFPNRSQAQDESPRPELEDELPTVDPGV